ncbi:type VI secretion system lipoprotein TssJ [Pseudoxanthobacter soli]|nr:type VI secretion system lipoprotein TssJ [Pseudoxanthobacter soli]
MTSEYSTEKLESVCGAQPRVRKLGRRAFVLGSLGMVAGCGLFPGLKKTTLLANISADGTINPNATGEPSPVLMRVYVLKSDMMFLQADFQSMMTNDEQALGPDFISKKEFFLTPNKQVHFKEMIPPDARFVAAIALFRSIDTAAWHSITPVRSDLINTVTITLSGTILKAQMTFLEVNPLF